MEHQGGEHKVYLRLHGELKDRFLEIKDLLGLENDTEVCRSIINDYWIRNRDKFQPKLRHFHINPDGVLILDPEIDSLVQVHVKPDSIECAHCKLNNCKHTVFALSLPEVQKLLQKAPEKFPARRHMGEAPALKGLKKHGNPQFHKSKTHSAKP